MIEVKYDELKGLRAAEYIQRMLNDGWEILNLQPIRDEGMLTYGIMLKRKIPELRGA